MSAVPGEKDKFERRAFPRFCENCQIHYFSQGSGTWNEATLENYSASGLSFICEEKLPPDTKITVQITRDAHPKVPPMAASAVVVRCELDKGVRIKVACKLTNIRGENIKKHHYLLR
jgi:hypothetical protein